MKEILKVAILQTSLDNKAAWSTYAVNKPKMNEMEAVRVWNEIIHTMDDYVNLVDTRKPDVILLPEFSVAEQFENEIRNLADQTGSIIITGLDFKVKGNNVRNQALVAIPYRWPHGLQKSRAKTFYFGKHFPAKEEKEYLKSCGKEFDPCNEIYILDAGEYGRIGLAICADFYDIERYALYKGRIQHLFILAYNKDVKSFLFLAESISRLVYCNVIICNTGHYGGSICFSLKEKEYQRYIYRHEGARLFTNQIVELPVRSFKESQKAKGGHGYKNAPPEYELYNESDEDKEKNNKKIE